MMQLTEDDIDISCGFESLRNAVVISTANPEQVKAQILGNQEKLEKIEEFVNYPLDYTGFAVIKKLKEILDSKEVSK